MMKGKVRQICESGTRTSRDQATDGRLQSAGLEGHRWTVPTMPPTHIGEAMVQLIGIALLVQRQVRP